MKRKVLIGIILALSLVGCGNFDEDDNRGETVIVSKDNDSDEKDEDVDAADKKEDKTESSDEKESDDSIQAELASVEEEYQKLYDNTDSGSMSQCEMNEAAFNLYDVWDKELNSLWERLTEELDESEKKELVAEQKAWIAQKEANSTAAGMSWSGGSGQPCITLGEEEDMTHKRCYELAERLAEVRGEDFEIPSKVEKKIEEENPTLDEVFEKFEGQWCFDTDRGAVIGIDRTANDPDMAPEGSTWYVWETGGDIISDLDVYGYSDSDIIFKRYNEFLEKDSYYWMSYCGDRVEFKYAHSLEELADWNVETTVGY